MLGRYDAMVARLCESVLRSASDLDVPRREASARGDLQGPAAAYARKVRESSYRVVDEDFAAMKAAGFTEEQIYDLTVSAALGAAKERLDRANEILRGKRSA
jgi:alkylhydroperoxidase family enzyme